MGVGPRALLYRLRCWVRRREVHVWHEPHYRLPLSGVEAARGIEPRRADHAAFWLRASGAVPGKGFRTPRRIPYADLARVHTPELLESLGRPEALAAIFSVDPSDVPVDELMSTVRLACDATLQGAREALATRCPSLNLLGGFHHAGPGSAGGFCPVNDIAVALAALRLDGFAGRAVVLDLDAHPPDGVAACLASDRNSWIGSLSGSDWGRLDGVDEVVLPEGTRAGEYLEALGELLERMPRAQLAFVIAGGDVLGGDRFGRLSLTLHGVRLRDLLVAAELEGTPAVWLPGGGYTDGAWRALAGTGMALATGSLEPIPESYDPLGARFTRIAQSLSLADLGDSGELTADDLEEALGIRRTRPRRLLLGFYTAAGMEHAFFRYGVTDQMQRLGYRHFRVAFDRAGAGERLRVFGEAEGGEHLLVETVLEKRRIGGADVLYVHWLSLRHPLAQFSERRPRLPGQDVPGLGLAREAGEMLALMAVRLGLAGVVFRPSTYHLAFQARHDFAFVDAARQGRFEALVRDMRQVPLLEATQAVAEGRVLLNGEPYAWEADEMAYWLQKPSAQAGEVARERERVRFTLLERAPAQDPAAPTQGPAAPARSGGTSA